MKIKYPAEAFALGMILFSTGLKEAFASGILVILTVVLAEFLKNLLEPLVPVWSLRLCVLIASGSVCASSFLLGLSVLRIRMDHGTYIMAFLVGLLAAKHVLTTELQAEYGEIFWESGIFWGFWVLLSIVREFMGTGSVFGNLIFQGDFQSKSFQEITFGFLAAGLALAFTNGALKKKSSGTESLALAVPLVIFARPFEMVSFGALAGQLWTIAVPILLFVSVRKTLRFSRTGSAFRGLPTEVMALGFIYMILSIY